MPDQPARMTVHEIAARLAVSEPYVYRMLEQGVIPGIRLKRIWIVTRRAYERWESECGYNPQNVSPQAKVS